MPGEKDKPAGGDTKRVEDEARKQREREGQTRPQPTSQPSDNNDDDEA